MDGKWRAISPAGSSSSRTRRRMARRVGSATAFNASSTSPPFRRLTGLPRGPCSPCDEILLAHHWSARDYVRSSLHRSEPLVDLIDSLDRTFQHAHSVIAQVGPSQYDNPTPCEE